MSQKSLITFVSCLIEPCLINWVIFLQDFVDYRINRNKMLRSRRNQILLAFSFWGDIQYREPPNIYELRTYVLKVILKKIYWLLNVKSQDIVRDVFIIEQKLTVPFSCSQALWLSGEITGKCNLSLSAVQCNCYRPSYDQLKYCHHCLYTTPKCY